MINGKACRKLDEGVDPQPLDIILHENFEKAEDLIPLIPKKKENRLIIHTLCGERYHFRNVKAIIFYGGNLEIQGIINDY